MTKSIRTTLMEMAERDANIIAEKEFASFANETDELLEMSSAEKSKREDIVMSMKKKAGDFKKKYGSRWKEVMYATATKQAMGEEVTEEEVLAELSSKTLKSYFKKSEADQKDAQKKSQAAWSKGDKEGSIPHYRREVKRVAGQGRAFDKLMDRGHWKNEDFEALDDEELEYVIENSDQLDELSNAALHDYINAAAANMNDHNRKFVSASYKKDDAGAKHHLAKTWKRSGGIKQANKILGKRYEKQYTREDFASMTEEEFESLLENFEQLDELSKKTLGRYIKDASSKAQYHAYYSGVGDTKAGEHRGKGFKKVADADQKNADEHGNLSRKRAKGVRLATDKLIRKESFYDLTDGIFSTPRGKK